MSVKKQACTSRRMLDIASGYWLSQAVYVAAKLGLADVVAERPRPVSELAAAVGANSAALERVMRALVSANIFDEEDGSIVLTPLAAIVVVERGNQPSNVHPHAWYRLALACMGAPCR